MRTFLPALLLAACTAGGDIIETDAGTVGFDPPDITGTYDVEVGEGLDPSDTALFEGELVISGEADALTWAFPGFSFPGSVNDTSAFDFAGAGRADEAISGAGTAFLSGGVWNLDGDLTVNDDAATFTAVQVLE